ncbi:MAG: Flp pilus assembly complex ATPase component TadA [Acidobacteria bacterium]|nr:Flp pilus assembly complex ATPase component TadA [Acidobacteriota bacterium]
MTDAELDDRLAELLVGYQLLTPAALDRARSFQSGRGGTLAGALTELHVVPPDRLQILLEELTGVRSVDPSLMTVYPDFVERMNLLIPPEVVASLLVFPAQAELNALHVCMINPTDGWTARALESLSGCRIMPLVSHEAAVQGAIEKHYSKHLAAPVRYRREGVREIAEQAYKTRLAAPFDDLLKPAIALMNRNRDALARDPAALETIVRDPLIIRLVHQMLCRAIEGAASDLHIQPDGESLRIRGRFDGALRVLHKIPLAASAPVIGRLRAMAELPIRGTTTPLDARIGFNLVYGRAIDLRFSLVPSVTGDKVVLRVLDRERARRRLVDLGVDEPTRQSIEDATDLPNGLMLVTGPTGSGKTSTLYALLDRLNEDDVCILTAEDPVESRMEGITQVQCDDASGVAFAAALRSFLRQDPDILMVGEIRDAETADIALKAALTGHLVLSTMHTNDAPSAVLRMVNMDLEPFLIASALRLVIAQRLIRRLCPACKQPLARTSEKGRLLVDQLAAAGLSVAAPSMSEPVGCDQCGGTGYRGRVGIFEVLRVTERIEELIIARASAAAIRAQARAEGMQTLRLAGLRKFADGETSMAEVLEHTVPDDQRVESAVERIERVKSLPGTQ